MHISNIKINSFRNLTSFEFDCHDYFNFFYGANGAGKTSILEAIYYLGLGRSFRSKNALSLLSHNSDSFVVFANIYSKQTNIPVGVTRNSNNSTQIRIAEDSVRTHLKITELCPLQLIAAKDYRLIEGGAEYRRQIMDWGLFHVEQNFMTTWQKARQALRQCNATLKTRSVDKNQLGFWQNELVVAANYLNEYRQRYVKALQVFVTDMLNGLLPSYNVELSYYAGWDEKQPLGDILAMNFENDMRIGYVTAGPHRADIKIKFKNVNVQEILSRGQQKVLIYALRLAQGKLLQEQIGKKCVYLIDDLPSELDVEKRDQIFDILNNMKIQSFITGIYHHDFINNTYEKKMFHVKQGAIA